MIQIETKLDVQGIRLRAELINLPANLKKRVLKNALNSTARKVLKTVKSKTKKEYTFARDLIKDTDKEDATKTSQGKTIKHEIIKAKNNNLQSVVKVKSEVLDILDYQVSPKNALDMSYKPKVLKGKLLKKGKLKELYINGNKAFIAKFGSHLAVVARKGKSRLPLHTFLAPAISQLEGSKRVFDPIKDELNNILSQEVSKQIKKVVK